LHTYKAGDQGKKREHPLFPLSMHVQVVYVFYHPEN
jgi:hypothetical protein